jgi:hypothetical protein
MHQLLCIEKINVKVESEYARLEALHVEESSWITLLRRDFQYGRSHIYVNTRLES